MRNVFWRLIIALFDVVCAAAPEEQNSQDLVTWEIATSI